MLTIKYGEIAKFYGFSIPSESQLSFTHNLATNVTLSEVITDVHNVRRLYSPPTICRPSNSLPTPFRECRFLLLILEIKSNITFYNYLPLEANCSYILFNIPFYDDIMRRRERSQRKMCIWFIVQSSFKCAVSLCDDEKR